MSNPLGLSIGTTNLVAASVGHQPVIRRSVLTLFGQAAPEVGTPRQEPAGTGGVVLSGFVDRIGDPVPLVAADGATYPAEQLLVEALESMAGLALSPSHTSASDLVIAVPSYWSPAMTAALQTRLGASEILAPGALAPRLIPDAVAALTALDAGPGIDRHGTLVLLDFGGGGTSITLADAASAFEVIDGTERIPELAGDQIDQALLSHVLQGITDDGTDDSGQTAAVGSLAMIREQCRSAKERLSRQTVTELNIELPGHRADIRVTRAELEDLIERPLDGVLDALEDMLGRNNISWGAVSAVALVGGGASIPLIVQRLSERSQARVVTTAQPGLDAGVGAAQFAAYGREADVTTGVAPAASAPALAWSQDDEPDDVVPYSGDDYVSAGASPNVAPGVLPNVSRNPYGPAEDFKPTFRPEPAAPDDVKPWQRLPVSVFGIAAAVALVAVGGVAIALTSVDNADRNQPKPSNAPLTSAFTPSAPPAETITLNNQPAQPAPEPTTAVAPPSVVATTTPPTPAPTTTTTAPTTTMTTTTTTTTTTTPVTTTPVTTTPATTVPPTTSATTVQPTATPTPTTAATVPTSAPTSAPTAARSEPTTAAITTSLLTVPFVPVPIPIPVPASP